jgi:glycosyltransferase involved in cell wall biosynthesis
VSEATYRLCDQIIVPNADEAAFLGDRLGLGEKTAVIGLGIEQRRLEELSAARPEGDTGGRAIAFIGTWNARKGSHDWPAIVAGVRRLVADAPFVFLGTHVPEEELRRALRLDAGSLEVVPSYSSEQLGGLLANVRAGALPSYIEGFGIGVLEKMAAGIPTVCYDVPGPRETMGRVDRRLLVPAGDTQAFAERLVELLQLDEASYQRLGMRCREVAAEFSWRVLARRTLAVYHERLEALRAQA